MPGLTVIDILGFKVRLFLDMPQTLKEFTDAGPSRRTRGFSYSQLSLLKFF